MKKTFSFIILFLSDVYAFSQTNPPLYDLRIKQADSLYQLKQYEKSALMYYSAFEVFNGKGLLKDRYNVARSWALAGTPDSAFKNLNKIIKHQFFTDYEKLKTEKDFISLYSDSRWKILIDSMDHYKLIKKTGTIRKIANISIKNDSKKYICLYHITPYHEEIFYYDIRPKKTFEIETYIGTIWVLKRKDEKTQIIEFQITKEKQRFNTSGNIPKKN